MLVVAEESSTLPGKSARWGQGQVVVRVRGADLAGRARVGDRVLVLGAGLHAEAATPDLQRPWTRDVQVDVCG